MRNKLIGFALVIHGLAHTAGGMWASDLGNPILVTLLWEIAAIGFIVAGGDMLGLYSLERLKKWIMISACVASIALLMWFFHPALMIGVVVDAVIIVYAVMMRSATTSSHARRHHRIATPLFIIFTGYAAAVIGLRNWMNTWGTNADLRSMALVGDPPGASHYKIDHAVMIAAPADSVWKWVVQLGQDRAGFYSYDWLERVIGAEIHNASEINPAWQKREVGDLVRATQPGYLGGMFGDSVGWRVTQIVPQRAMILENWGAFVVRPVDEKTSQLYVRTRGPGEPTAFAVMMSPIGMLTFEPAHFIMERRMLLGVKARAERQQDVSL